MIYQLPLPLQYQARWGDGGPRGDPLSPINNLIQIWMNRMRHTRHGL